MSIKKQLLTLFFAVMMLGAMGLTVSAQEGPDLSRRGSVTVKMRLGETAVPGGTLTLYQAGTVRQENGSYSYTLARDFIGSGESLEEIQSDRLAKSLSDYAKSKDLRGITEEINENGSVSFADLEPGLYLLVQEKAAGGYKAVEPFLVSIPMMENGVYRYDVDASPKVETLEKDRQTEPETEPGSEPETERETEPKNGGGTGGNGTSSKSTLPQTGQLNWPVPVLAASGLALFVAGWILRFEKRKKANEK